MYRRNTIVGIAFVLLASLVGPAPAQTPPIRIGVMYPLTGVLAMQGAAARDAVRQAFEEENYQIAGRKVELFYEDSQGRPDTGLTKMRALVERDRVHLLLSELTSSVGAAIAPYVNEQKIPWVNTVALSALTRGLRSPYTYRFTPSAYQIGVPAVQWARKQGWKKVYFIGWNAPPSREAFEVVKKVFGEENIVDAMFPPVNTPDYSPYLTKLDPGKADGIFVALWGADSPRIAGQFAEYGLKGKLPFVGMGAYASEDLLPHMPPTAEGIISVMLYCGTLDTPENKRFVEGYKARYKSVPGSYQYTGYMAAKFMIEGLKQVNGRAEDREGFAAALRTIKLRGPMGLASFDERQGMVSDFYVLKIARKDGQLQNECGERIPQVRDPYHMFP